MYNKKVLREATKNLDRTVAPAKKKDMIVDPMGQWKYPGQNTRIPGNDITMQGVPYPVWAIPNVGTPQMMYPGQNYYFPGADHVDEYPQIAQRGGDISIPQLNQYEDGGEYDLTQEEIDDLISQGYQIEELPQAQVGRTQGTKWNGDYYSYPTREDSLYNKDKDGWYVKNLNTKGNWFMITDPKRIANLEKNAKKMSQFELDRWTAETGFGETLGDKEYIQKMSTGKYTPEKAAKEVLFDNEFSVKKDDFTNYGVDQTINKHNTALDFHEGWMNSPMYKEMLKKSSPQEWEELNRLRLQNFNDIKNSGSGGYGLYSQPKDYPNRGGASYPSTGQIEYYPLSEGVTDISAHEISHSIDRNRILPNNEYSARLIPLSNTDYIESIRPKSFFDSPIYKNLDQDAKQYYKENPQDAEQKNEWINYVSEPTETRARLNAIRAISKESGIYDPYTEKVTPEIYNLLKTKNFESLDKEGFDPLKQLRGVYTDEQIMHMLNTISKNDNQPTDINQAKFGGTPKSLPKKKNSKAYSRSLTATNKLFAESNLTKKTKSRKNKFFDPTSKYLQDGGPYNMTGPNQINQEPEPDTDAMNAMMKARFAYEQMHGNPAVQRMVVAPDQPYIYTGQEFDRDYNMPVGAPEGATGTHYMAAFNTHAVPFIQQGPTGLYFNELPSIKNREAIKFDRKKDAQYFSEHYKEIAPDPSYREYQKGGFQDDLGKHRKLLRDWTYGASIGMLHKAQVGAQKGASNTRITEGDYKFSERPGSTYRYQNGQWLISNSGTKNKFVPMQDPDGKRAKTLTYGLTTGSTKKISQKPQTLNFAESLLTNAANNKYGKPINPEKYTYVDPVSNQKIEFDSKQDFIDKQKRNLSIGKTTNKSNEVVQALGNVLEYTGVPGAIRTYGRIKEDPLKFAENIGITARDLHNLPQNLAYQGVNYLWGDGTFNLPVNTEALGVSLDAAGLLPFVPKGTSRAVKQGVKMVGDDIARGYTKVATGNSRLTDFGFPAWKVERPTGVIRSSDYIVKPYTDYETELLTKYGFGMRDLTPEDWAHFSQLTKSGVTDFSKGNYPISRVIGYYAPGSSEKKAIEALKRGDVFATPTEKSIRTWSVGVPKLHSGHAERTRLIIPSRYTKDLGSHFAGMPYYDKRVDFLWNHPITKRLNTSAFPEKELMGNIPEGFKVIGRSSEDGMNNLIIKPIKKSGSPISVPESSMSGIDYDVLINSPMYQDPRMRKFLENEMRLQKEGVKHELLPESKSLSGQELFNDFKKRIRTEEGRKRLKALGISNPEKFDDYVLKEIENSIAYHKDSPFHTEYIGLHKDIPENIVKKITRHELEHAVQRVLRRPGEFNTITNETTKQEGLTEIDDILEGLEFKGTPTPKEQWTQKPISEEPIEMPSTAELFSDPQRNLDYFVHGSGGKERSAFLSELQQAMLEDGIIDDVYQKITPEKVKEAYNLYMQNPDVNKYTLRLLEIITPTEKNFEKLSKGLNKMLTLTPIAIGAGAAATQGETEQKNPIKLQFGGEPDYEDMDLTPEEIDWYLANGYDLEDLGASDTFDDYIPVAQTGAMIPSKKLIGQTEEVITPKTLPNKTAIPEKKLIAQAEEQSGVTPYVQSIFDKRKESPYVATKKETGLTPYAKSLILDRDKEEVAKMQQKYVDNAKGYFAKSPFAYNPLSKFLSENPIMPEQSTPTPYVLGLMDKPHTIIGGIEKPAVKSKPLTSEEQTFLEEQIKAKLNPQSQDIYIDDLFPVESQWADRFLEKQGVIEIKESKLDPKKTEAKKTPVKEVTPKPAKFYQELGTVPDSYDPKNNLLSYRNQWDNKEGFEYIATPVKKDRSGKEEYRNVKGVGHFLLDASVADGKTFKWDDNESYLRDAKKNNEWIPAFTRVKGDRVKLQYKKPNELTKKDIVVTPLRQMKYDDIRFDVVDRPIGFQKGIKEVKRNDGQGTYLIFKNRDGYSRFSGGSVVFIFKDQYGNTIVRDFAGSLNGIENEGINIKKEYKLKPGELTIGYHDVGSFSAKPKADSSGTVRSSQWEGFNNSGVTGGALLIPND